MLSEDSFQMLSTHHEWRLQLSALQAYVPPQRRAAGAYARADAGGGGVLAPSGE